MSRPPRANNEHATTDAPRAAYLTRKRAAQLLALAFVVAGIVAALFVPSYESYMVISSGTAETERLTALAVDGPAILVALAVPLVVAAVPLFLRGRPWLIASIAVAVLLGAYVVVALASIGIFFLPAFVTAIIAACLRTRPRSPA